MITHGTVIKKTQNISKIRIGTKEGCNSCGRCGKYRDKVVSAYDMTESTEGDEVRVEISDKKYRQSIICLYCIPLLAFIIGIFLGYYVLTCGLSTNLVDIISVVCGIIALAIAYLIIWMSKSKFDNDLVAKVLAVIK